MTIVEYLGKMLAINGKEIEFDERIEKICRIGSNVFVLLDTDAKAKSGKAYGNIVGFNDKGEFLWAAELPPSNMSSDRFWDMSCTQGLIGKTFSSFECFIDPSSGKILNTVFYK